MSDPQCCFETCDSDGRTGDVLCCGRLRPQCRAGRQQRLLIRETQLLLLFSLLQSWWFSPFSWCLKGLNIRLTAFMGILSDLQWCLQGKTALSLGCIVSIAFWGQWDAIPGTYWEVMLETYSIVVPGGVFTFSYRKLSAHLILYSVQDWLEETVVLTSISCSPDHVQQPHLPFQCPRVCTGDPWVGTRSFWTQTLIHCPVYSGHNWDSYSWLVDTGQLAKSGWIYASTAQLAELYSSWDFSEKRVSAEHPSWYLQSASMTFS